jgi:hypothetical protein
MARITPKTNWVANDIPVAPDFNRIENNNEQAFAELDQEVSDRQAAITAEQNARIAADNTLQSNIDNIQVRNISAGNTHYLSGPFSSLSTSDTSYVTLFSRRILANGNLRINFTQLIGGVITGNTAFARVLKNGSQVQEWSITSGSAVRNLDLAVSSGDLLSFQLRVSASNAGSIAGDFYIGISNSLNFNLLRDCILQFIQ